jgi:hypothetical protein
MATMSDTGASGMDEPRWELDANALNDEQDREELRSRFYGLLQELRVLLPGTQVLVAFLLTVPFNSRFGEIDHTGQLLYGAALAAGTLAIVALIAPTAFHRFGDRRSRAERLEWSIRFTRVGVAFLAVSLLLSLTLVARFVFGPGPSWATAVVGAAVVIGVWVVFPWVAIRDEPEPAD